MGKNLVILEGNMGADPELRFTPSGTAVANFSLATNNRWTSKDGEKMEHTEWHRCVAWRGLAEVAGKYGHKGKNVLIEGKLSTRKWDDKDGVTRYVTEIIVRDLQLLGKGKTDRPEDQEGYTPPGNGSEGVEDPVNIPDDDIPF